MNVNSEGELWQHEIIDRKTHAQMLCECLLYRRDFFVFLDTAKIIGSQLKDKIPLVYVV